MPFLPADVVLMLLLAAGAGAALPFWAWRRAMRRVWELEARLLPRTAEDARLEQLQAGLDALGHQADQLAEGQDFLNRVLTERLPPQVTRQRWSPPEITPH